MSGVSSRCSVGVSSRSATASSKTPRMPGSRCRDIDSAASSSAPCPTACAHPFPSTHPRRSRSSTNQPRPRSPHRTTVSGSSSVASLSRRTAPARAVPTRTGGTPSRCRPLPAVGHTLPEPVAERGQQVVVDAAAYPRGQDRRCQFHALVAVGEPSIVTRLDGHLTQATIKDDTVGREHRAPELCPVHGVGSIGFVGGQGWEESWSPSPRSRVTERHSYRFSRSGRCQRIRTAGAGVPGPSAVIPADPVRAAPSPRGCR